jgi:phosphoglycolate phosphatase
LYEQLAFLQPGQAVFALKPVKKVMEVYQYEGGQSIQAIIFDKDGTLADARPFLRELAIARAQACADVLFQGSSDEAKAYFDSLCLTFGVNPTGLNPDGLMAVGTRVSNEQAAINLFLSMGGGLEESRQQVPQLFAAVDNAVECKAAQTPPFPGTREMLLQLGRSPIRVGILSSDRTSGVEEFLRYYGLEEFVDEWRGTEPDDEPKPNPQLFWEMCDRLQVSPHQTLMVGDSWADLEVTRNAGGAGFISVSERWGRPPLTGSDYVIQSWNDLLDLINSFDPLSPNSRSLGHAV